MNIDSSLLLVAWLVVLAWSVIDAPRFVARARADAMLFAALVAVALAARLALPWGPLNFVEAERLQALWGTRPAYPPTFDTIPVLLGALRFVGVPAAALARTAGPVFGALAVGTAFLLGRAGGLGRAAAALGAAVLLGFPAHVHFSTSVGFSVEGPALWTAAYATALSTRLDPRWRVALVAALTVLGVHARPEYRLLGVALIPLVLTPHWTWRQRGALTAALAVGMASYARYLRVDHLAESTSGLSGVFVPWVFHDLAVNPVWWLVTGALGLVAGRMRWPLRAALGLATGLTLAAYWALASDGNPLWGQWRYYVSLVPFLAVAAGSLVEWLPDRASRWRDRAVAALAVATAASGIGYLPLLRRPNDLPVEFAWLRETAPRVLRGRPTVLLLANRRREGESRVLAEGTPLMALGTTVGPTDWPRRCDERVNPGAPRGMDVRDLEEWALRCPTAEGFDPTRAVVYLGLYRPDERVAALTARWRLMPLEERVTSVAVTAPAVDTACPVEPGTLIGSAQPDCTVRLGWYRLVPR